MKSHFDLFKPLVQKVLHDFYQSHKIPSLSFALLNSDSLINFTSFGSININSNNCPTPATIFDSASTTKAFTSIMLLQLRDKGLLSLDDPIKIYLSDKLSQKSEFLSLFGDVTLRNLASHSAGLPQEGDFDRWDIKEMVNFKAITPDLSLERLFKPYEGFHYSNIGYILLGSILEKIAKRPYQDYVSEEILKPLGMNSSGFGSTLSWDQQNVAKGYLQRDEGLELAPISSFKEGDSSGGLRTNVEDLVKYLQWILKNDNQKVLKSNKELLNPCVSYHPGKNIGRKMFKSRAYGLGINIGDYNEQYLVYYHSGGLPGFRSYWLMVPELDFAIILWQNSDHFGIRAILEEVLEILIFGIKTMKKTPIVQKKIKETKLYKHFLGDTITIHFTDDGSVMMDCRDMNGEYVKGINLETIEEKKRYKVANGNDLGEIVEFYEKNGENDKKKFLGATVKYKGGLFRIFNFI